MVDKYFSDREIGSKPRSSEEISIDVWGGIVSLVRSQVISGGFGADFPEECPDGLGPKGTNEYNIGLALKAEIPEIEWPLREDNLPPTLAILDFVEFCHSAAANPIQGSFHKFFGHYHLKFDRETGQEDFRQKINRSFMRNGVAFELLGNGQIQRLTSPILQDVLRKRFNTGDAKLNVLLEAACSKFVNHDPSERHEALEKLWDAWERIKTVEPGKNKKESASALLDKVSAEPNFRERLEAEAIELTSIGNSFQTRHSETNRIPLESNNHIDYLFHRLYALINLLLLLR